MARVVVCTEQRLLAAGLRPVLEGHVEIAAVVSELPRLPQACRDAGAALCLVVLDRAGALPEVADVVRLVPADVILMTPDPPQDDVLLAAVQAGVVGWLLLDIAPERLPDVVRGVLAGEVALPRRGLRRLLVEVRSRAPKEVRAVGGRVRLTGREHQVLELMSRGLDTRAVARQLDVHPVTVRSYLADARRKLGARTRAEAVRLFAGG